MTNWLAVSVGVAIMCIAAILIAVIPITMQVVIGLGLLFIVGLGLTLAGSPEVGEKK